MTFTNKVNIHHQEHRSGIQVHRSNFIINCCIVYLSFNIHIGCEWEYGKFAHFIGLEVSLNKANDTL